MIVCKSAVEIEKMRRSGHIVREVLDHVRGMVGRVTEHTFTATAMMAGR